MGGKRTEACGRCSVSTVVDASDAEDGDTGGRNPFDGSRIELDEDELRSVVRHEVFFSRLRRRLDEWATRVTFGR
ncbi:hypothetical protein AArcSl_3176 [Halalkaliarchaeum desulfuricum]|uniref:Uncharacterized protein n=1 Tax=Halalkaliarchaeum desulfuricum TaxID=2055893 RepID=A0A343TNW0_9EURY|nr:hypothetical protein [Halalkaliarchaeum desulfuricum]AUX10782.1 hypothetical protein AArcSl_3176 [Halalkaliarchaeum desulfuricum]